MLEYLERHLVQLFLMTLLVNNDEARGGCDLQVRIDNGRLSHPKSQRPTSNNQQPTMRNEVKNERDRESVKSVGGWFIFWMSLVTRFSMLHGEWDRWPDKYDKRIRNQG
jgi:hypothetical protein